METPLCLKKTSIKILKKKIGLQLSSIPCTGYRPLSFDTNIFPLVNKWSVIKEQPLYTRNWDLLTLPSVSTRFVIILWDFIDSVNYSR